MSDVYHYSGLTFWGPADDAQIDHLLNLLHLKPNARVLDVGCGRAEILIRLASKYGARVTGVERSPHALALARAAFNDRAPNADVSFLEQPIDAFAPTTPFDAILWIGGPYIGATFAETLTALKGWLRPGGLLLIGHGFWSQLPDPAYLEATGIAADEFTPHIDNIALGQSLGLRPMYCCVSSREAWDIFEGTIHANVERYAFEHPDAPDPQGRLEQRRAWFMAQQRWGRDTMGFGYYLFHVPEAPDL